MYFLVGINNRQEQVILYVQGYTNNIQSGFCSGEGIFEVTDMYNPMIIRQVGFTAYTGNHLIFHYTDHNFKKEINYQEKTGESLLDGLAWRVFSQDNLRPAVSIPLIYTNAKKPHISIYSALHSMFQKSSLRTASDQVVNTPIRPMIG